MFLLYHHLPAHHHPLRHLLHHLLLRIGMRLQPGFLKVTLTILIPLAMPLPPFRPSLNRSDGSKSIRKQLLTLIVQNFRLR